MHDCNGSNGAVTTTQVGSLNVWSCAVCGNKGSDQPCAIGRPHADATGTCRACGKFTCDQHRSKRSRTCETCVKKLALLKTPAGRGPRYGKARLPYADR